MDELNPEHPVTREMHNQWHKIVALLMLRFNVSHIEFTSDDIMALAEEDVAVVINSKMESLDLDLISMEQARKLAGEGTLYGK